MDSGIITAVVGAVSVIVAGFLAGFWQWKSGQKKGAVDAQGALISGFVVYAAELKAERAILIKMITDLENNNQRQDRRVAKLENFIIRQNLELPEDEE